MSGSLLYPRLGREVGRQLIAEQAPLALKDLEQLGNVSHPSSAPAPTGGHPVEASVLVALQDRVRQLAVAAGYPAPLTRGQEQRFDRPCGAALYTMMGVVTADAAEEGVWSFLSLVLTPEIGAWRFPDRAEERLLGRPRNVFRRLWWRAWALGADLDGAPAGCTPLGEDEFVQIMERPSLGGNQRTARALRDALWRAECGGSTVARSELMRQVTRRLRAVRSHVALDVLSGQQLSDLLDDLTSSSHRQLSGSDLTLSPLVFEDLIDDDIQSIREVTSAEVAEADSMDEVLLEEEAVDAGGEIEGLVDAYTHRHQLVSKGEIRELRTALETWLKQFDYSVLLKAIRASSTLGGIEDQARRVQKRLDELANRPNPRRR